MVRKTPLIRDRTILRIKEVGRRQWKKESGYHRQARVGNTFFRYETIIGEKLRARHPESQAAEALTGCNIRHIWLGGPHSLMRRIEHWWGTLPQFAFTNSRTGPNRQVR